MDELQRPHSAELLDVDACIAGGTSAPQRAPQGLAAGAFASVFGRRCGAAHSGILARAPRSVGRRRAAEAALSGCAIWQLSGCAAVFTRNPETLTLAHLLRVSVFWGGADKGQLSVEARAPVRVGRASSTSPWPLHARCLACGLRASERIASMKSEIIAWQMWGREEHLAKPSKATCSMFLKSKRWFSGI